MRPRAHPLIPLLLAAIACQDPTDPRVGTTPTGVEPGGQSSSVEGENVVTTLANDGPGSLRDRVFFATSGSTITFAENLAGQTITVSSPILLNQTLTIEGPASGGITISGGGASQVFQASAGITAATVTLRNLTITGADVGNLFSGHGAGIFNGGATLEIVGSTISGNAGIGVFNADGELTIENSTISGNGQVGVDFSGGGPVALRHVTITGNARGLQRSGSLLLTNTLLADNGIDCSTAPGAAQNIFGGVNLDSDESCGLVPSIDLVGVDPQLGPLADNGGPTRTHALPFGSPALDAFAPCLAVDQRGVPRPQGPKCDIGAYERVPISVTVTIGPSGRVDPKTGMATISGSMTCSLPLAVELQVGLTQMQMVRRVPVPKESSSTATVSCTAERTWTIAVAPPSGSAFLNGTATVEAEALNSDSPSATSRSVRLFWAKK